MLLEERMKLARATGTAPYAVCGDATIKKMALVRPSTRARLTNIDGVNQHFITTHGDHFLQSIRHLSLELNLSLDGEASIGTVVGNKGTPVPSHQRKLTPAKVEAWRMWHEDGLSIQQIAKFPGRSAPIKEETVLSYLLEAFLEGLATDWPRLCNEIELTAEIFTEMQDAVTKVGSTEKLKPIKDVLPENVSYLHIKICLAMINCGISSPSTLKNFRVNEAAEATETSFDSLGLCYTEGPCNFNQSLVKSGKIAHNSLEENEETKLCFPEETSKLPLDNDSNTLSSKRCKIDTEGNGGSNPMKATESSVVDWLRKHDHGVALHDILEQFRDSSEESVRTLLSDPECNFVIYKKNDCFRLF